MAACYNEIDPYAAQWLRNLIAAGHIAPGVVDHRPVQEVRANDLCGYAQCHFFAGIGGWSYALRLAGWSDDREVWTGSCPCQPFSVAGQRQGFDDKRHLWPAWFRLIAQCRPPVVLGEQVEAAIKWGWLDAVFADMEAEGYTCRAAVLPACSVGAPHIRQRLWFVADADASRCGSGRPSQARDGRDEAWVESAGFLNAGELGDAERPRFSEQRGNGSLPSSAGGADARQTPERAGASAFWSDCVWLSCTDGKARPAQPGIQPLAHGVPARVGKLRAAGNAIVPQVAVQFIRAVMDRFQSRPRSDFGTQTEEN